MNGFGGWIPLCTSPINRLGGHQLFCCPVTVNISTEVKHRNYFVVLVQPFNLNLTRPPSYPTKRSKSRVGNFLMVIMCYPLTHHVEAMHYSLDSAIILYLPGLIADDGEFVAD